MCNCTKTISIKALIYIDGKVLLLRDSHGHADFPGGRMRCDENIASALKREIQEELGLECELGQNPLHAFTWHNHQLRAHGLILIYRTHLPGQAAKSSISANEVGFSAFWVDKESLRNQNYPSFFKDGYRNLPDFDAKKQV